MAASNSNKARRTAKPRGSAARIDEAEYWRIARIARENRGATIEQLERMAGRSYSTVLYILRSKSYEDYVNIRRRRTVRLKNSVAGGGAQYRQRLRETQEAFLDGGGTLPPEPEPNQSVGRDDIAEVLDMLVSLRAEVEHARRLLLNSRDEVRAMRTELNERRKGGLFRWLK